ncbi:MAG: prepilin-type N-terminal cleavage/methylation domain-containing protein [Negativicutes bacterium]
MLNKLRSVKLGSKGFTLVELLVVIAILGILAAIVIPKLMGQNDAARVAKVKSDLATMEQATQIYAIQKSIQATTVADLVNGSYLVATPVPPLQNFTVHDSTGATITMIAGPLQIYTFSVKDGTSRPIFSGYAPGYFIEDISSWN